MNTAMKLGVSSLLLSLAAGLAAFAPAASAQSTSTGLIRNAAHGGCLTVSSTGLAIFQACNGSAVQQWTQINLGSHVLLRNAATGRCLDTLASGATVFSSACNGNVGSQRWSRFFVGTGAARFQSAVSPRFLASDTTLKVVTAPYSSSALQVWLF